MPNFPIKAEGDKLLEPDVLGLRRDLLNLGSDFAVTAGTGDDYTLALDAQITTLADGQIIPFKADRANTTTTPTINVNTIGAKALVDSENQSLLPSDIRTGGLYLGKYDATANNVKILGMRRGQANTLSTELIANEDLDSGRFVSVVAADATKCERTVIKHFQDGDIDTEASGFDSVLNFCEINDSKALAVGIHSGQMKARVVIVGADDVMTLGTMGSAIGSGLTPLKILQLDTALFVVLCEDSNVYKAVAISVDVNANTVSAGSDVALPNAIAHNSTNRRYADIDKYDATKFLAFYGYSTGSDVAAAVGSISGTTLTFATESVGATTMSTDSGSYVSVAVLSPTAAIGVYRQEDTNDDVSISEITLSSGSITGQNIVTGIVTSYTPRGIVKFSATQAIIFTADNSDNALRARLRTFNSSTGTIAIGTPPSAFTNYDIKPLFINSSYGYWIGKNGNDTVFFSFDLASLEAVFSSVSESFGTSTGDRNFALLATPQTNHGIKIIFANGTTATLAMHYGNFRKLVGMVNATVTSGNTATIYRAGVVTGLSGLTAGVKYYISSTGALTTTKTLFEAGVALSTTTLLLNIKKSRNKEVKTYNSSTISGVLTLGNLPVNDAWEFVQAIDGATNEFLLRQEEDSTKAVTNLTGSMVLYNQMKNPLFLEYESGSLTAGTLIVE